MWFKESLGPAVGDGKDSNLRLGKVEKENKTKSDGGNDGVYDILAV